MRSRELTRSKQEIAMVERRQLLSMLAAGLGATFCLLGPAEAQRLSDRTITLVVPFTAGTGPDLLARTLSEELRQRWNQPVVVENKAGASGNIGSQTVARAEPDGHTLMVTVNTFVMNASLFKSIPYDPQKSFEPIVELATGDVALVVHPSVPAKSVSEFVEWVKSRAGEINYGSPGRGTPQHLAMELLKLETKTDFKHVPYTGAAGALKDLVGGHISAMFLPVHTALPLAQENRIRMLAVGSAGRSPVAPDVPTLTEQGLPNLQVDLWFGLLAPAGTPKEIIDRYNTVVNEILSTPRVREALQKQGLTARGGPPERLAELIAKDQPRWAKVVKDAGIAPE
jgi:tripartite-type tricarboxylate transporter receptor subunit TctC